MLASAVIHGLVLAALLTRPQSDSDTTQQVVSVTNMVTIEALPERPVAKPAREEEKLKTFTRPDRQTALSKATALPPQANSRSASLQKPPAISYKARHKANAGLTVASSPLQSQPIAHTSVARPEKSAAVPQTARQPSQSKEGERKLVRKHLETFKYYPSSARRRGIEGHVDVGFTLAHNGTASKVAVLHGSGHAVLDQAAMKTVYRAQPFPVNAGEFRFRLRFKRL